MGAVLDAELLEWAASALGLEVVGCSPIGAGASRQIWRLTTSGPSFVLRVDTGDGPVAGTVLDLAREAVVYRALATSGIPLPRLIDVAPGGVALLMDYVAGDESLAGLGDPAARAAVGDDYLRWLGRLHRLEVATLDLHGLTLPQTPAEHALNELDLWMDIAAGRTKGWATPSVDVAAAWLRASAPAIATATSVCHGDAGPGNFLFADGRVTALLDWEFTHVGDPLDDLAWVAVRDHLLGRSLDLVRAFGVWTGETGWPVDAAAVEYYRVLVLLRMAVSCDTSLAWRNGVEDHAIRTQVILRPWLGTAIVAALGFAGCDEHELDAVGRRADDALAASPYAELLQLIPPLEPVVLP